MAELVDLAIYRRSKTGYNFGPQTLRGHAVHEPSDALGKLAPIDRVKFAIRNQWRTLVEIADMASLDENYVRRMCTSLVRSGAIEKRTSERINGAALYRLALGPTNWLTTALNSHDTSPQGPSAA